MMIHCWRAIPIRHAATQESGGAKDNMGGRGEELHAFTRLSVMCEYRKGIFGFKQDVLSFNLCKMILCRDGTASFLIHNKVNKL